MFRNAKIQKYSIVWKGEKYTEFLSLKKPKKRNPILEMPKSKIPMFGKAKIQNSNVWKWQNPEFQ